MPARRAIVAVYNEISGPGGTGSHPAPHNADSIDVFFRKVGGDVTTVPVRVGTMDMLVETARVVGSEPTSAIGTATEGTIDAFTHAQDAIAEIAATTIEKIERAAQRVARPDRVEIEFGVKISAGGHVIIAGAAGEATLRVTLTYETKLGAPAG
jgi:hypothetical protein